MQPHSTSPRNHTSASRLPGDTHRPKDEMSRAVNRSCIPGRSRQRMPEHTISHAPRSTCSHGCGSLFRLTAIDCLRATSARGACRCECFPPLF
jgi:hypothetical protein